MFSRSTPWNECINFDNSHMKESIPSYLKLKPVSIYEMFRILIFFWEHLHKRTHCFGSFFLLSRHVTFADFNVLLYDCIIKFWDILEKKNHCVGTVWVNSSIHFTKVNSGNFPRYVPGFPSQCPEKFLERFRIAPGLVSSKETRLTWTVYLVSYSLIC